jgi:hypothetical protein
LYFGLLETVESVTVTQVNETGTRTWSSDEVHKLTGATYRQLDHWCRNGVFGDKHKDPGSGTKRRFATRELFGVAVIKRISDTLQALNKVERTAGSTSLYRDVIRALAGETVDGITSTRVEVAIAATQHSELYVTIGDLRLRFSEETLNAQG